MKTRSCPDCEGRGEIQRCGGIGSFEPFRVWYEKCQTCKGSGEITEAEYNHLLLKRLPY